MNTLIISAEEIADLIQVDQVIPVVEEAFRQHGVGDVTMPPKIYVDFPESGGDLRVMPAYLAESGSAGVKIVSVHPGNRGKGLPTVMATILLNDPDTGYPYAVMDGTRITNIRTGIAGGVAAKYLARHDSEVVGLIGAGVQARTQLASVRAVLPNINKVVVWSLDPVLSEQLRDELDGNNGLSVEIAAGIEAACAVDVICTTTPSREPLIEQAWIRPGTHINAIGADAAGKQELDPELLSDSLVVCDEWEQARHSGELNIPVKNGTFTFDDLYGQLGQIVAGKIDGRSTPEQITIFDSTGLAIQDIAVAKFVYEKALAAGIGERRTIIDSKG